MFHYRDSREGDVRVDVAFTDSSVDLRGSDAGFVAVRAGVEAACGTDFFTRCHQVHGADVLMVEDCRPDASGPVPSADAMVTTRVGVGLMVRVADCVPVVLAAPGEQVVAAAHAGRQGVAHGVVGAAVRAMRARGAATIQAWIGPHVCGRCYEVPESMRAQICDLEPTAWATTRQGTPSLDLGAAVAAQLDREGVEHVAIGGCTMEDPGLHSYRRDGVASGRFAGLVWMT